MRVLLSIIFPFLLFANALLGQTISPIRIIETTQKEEVFNEESQPSEKIIKYLDNQGRDTLTAEILKDAMVLSTKTTYDDLGRLTSFSRYDGKGVKLSDVRFKYIKRGKRKTLIVITDHNGELFSKELEIVNEKGLVIEHRINYVQQNLKSINRYRYDDKDREVAYESFDGKRLDFFVYKQYHDLYRDYTEQDLIVSERLGVEPMGEDNLVYRYVYAAFDEHGNWTVRETHIDGELSVTTTRELIYEP
jgi:hypothetical protein